jgi:hypothetical protein
MGLFIRTIEIARAPGKVELTDLVYNMKRLLFLHRVRMIDNRSYQRLLASLRQYLLRKPFKAIAGIEVDRPAGRTTDRSSDAHRPVQDRSCQNRLQPAHQIALATSSSDGPPQQGSDQHRARHTEGVRHLHWRRKEHAVRQSVREDIDDKIILAMTEPLLAAYEDGLRTLKKLDAMVLAIAKGDAICRSLMTVPGVGPVVPLTFRTGVDVAHRFDKSRLVAAVFGLTPRVHASKSNRSGGSQNAATPWSAHCSVKPPTS